MSVSHSAQYEPTHSDVWTVLEELPHRIKALLKRHASSARAWLRGARARIARAVHARRVRGDARGAGAPGRGPAACVHRGGEASPGVPGREDVSVCGLIHPLIFLSNDTKDFLEYPLLHQHLRKPLHQWPHTLIRPVVYAHTASTPDETTNAYDTSPCSPSANGRTPSSPPPLPTTTAMQSPTH